MHSFAALGFGLRGFRPKAIGMNSLHRKRNGIARALFKRFRISIQGYPVLTITKASCQSNTNSSPGPLSPASAKIPEPLAHVLTVDVEDYFQVEAFAEKVKRDDWEQYPSRVDANTRRVLDLFDEHGAKGTFFFVGWVADRLPDLVREVHARGHELACHSYWHRTIYSLSPEEFREDTRRAKHAIENAAGVAVTGYRAPSWSITKDCMWALEILAEEGFTYDSSIYPIHHDLYGVPGAQRFPYTFQFQNERKLREYPPATLRFMGTNLPVAGGGYLRIFPAAYNEMAFRIFEKEYSQRVVVYLHPWEIDPDQPRIAGKLKSRFRHYTQLRNMSSKVGRLLKRYKFARFCDVLAAEDASVLNSQVLQTAGVSAGVTVR
jgi:polysaccharide deacetylase family protein (PEP-CTERM system associated)